MKPRNKTNKHEVYILVVEAGKKGAEVSAMARLLGVTRGVVQQHLWRLAKAGSIVNKAPGGGASEGCWVALTDPYDGAKDVSEMDQRWLRPGQYHVEIPRAPNSVWALAR